MFYNVKIGAMIKIEEQGLIGLLGDLLMIPIMYLLQLPVFDKPQRTHFWNNKKYYVSDIAHLDKTLFVSVSGDVDACNRWFGWIPIFHMPIFGGWKKFVVIEPKVKQDVWYVGWIPGDVIGISRIKLCHSVKLLRSPQTVYFFGLNEHGEQIEINIIGSGELGKDKKYSGVQFL